MSPHAAPRHHPPVVSMSMSMSCAPVHKTQATGYESDSALPSAVREGETTTTRLQPHPSTLDETKKQDASLSHPTRSFNNQRKRREQ
jgi:hypothetical protein